MSKFNKGDRVRFAGEGEVERVETYYRDQAEKVYVKRDGDGRTNIFTADSLTLIEPEYEHDGIYMDARDTVWRHTKNNGDQPWQKVSGGVQRGSYYGFDRPRRPLRKMEPVE